MFAADSQPWRLTFLDCRLHGGIKGERADEKTRRGRAAVHGCSIALSHEDASSGLCREESDGARLVGEGDSRRRLGALGNGSSWTVAVSGLQTHAIVSHSYSNRFRTFYSLVRNGYRNGYIICLSTPLRGRAKSTSHMSCSNRLSFPGCRFFPVFASFRRCTCTSMYCLGGLWPRHGPWLRY